MELAACLAGTLLVFGAGTGLLLWLISRRRQLEELDADDNKALRTLAMNRLLRTAATMASGLAAIAGNFSCRPDPSSTTAWTNAAGLGAMAVLLVMWWWPPPRLPSLQPLPGNRRRGLSAAGHPPALLSASIGAAIGMAAVLPALAALFLLGPALPAYGAAAVPAVMAARAAGNPRRGTAAPAQLRPQGRGPRLASRLPPRSSPPLSSRPCCWRQSW